MLSFVEPTATSGRPKGGISGRGGREGLALGKEDLTESRVWVGETMSPLLVPFLSGEPDGGLVSWFDFPLLLRERERVDERFLEGDGLVLPFWSPFPSPFLLSTVSPMRPLFSGDVDGDLLKVTLPFRPSFLEEAGSGCPVCVEDDVAGFADAVAEA
jgi:hypothetical protein